MANSMRGSGGAMAAIVRPRVGASRVRQGGSGRALAWSARGWYGVAVIGQGLFAAYVLALYGGAALRGDWAVWNQALPHGLVEGEWLGNAAVALHLLFAVVITVGGPLQLLPALRARWPAVHRWTGRLYVPIAFLMSLSGLFMVLTRGAVGDLSQHVAICANGLLIMLCAVFTWRHARARRFDVHRRWALRLFVVVSGVWFFRVGLMLWLVVHQRPVGFDPQSFTGPFLSFLAFAQYLLPLALLEAYFWAQRRTGPSAQWAVAGALGVLSLAMAVGIFGAVMGMWLPRLR